MIQEVISLARLRSMRPDEAAALLAARRSDSSGGTADDEALDAWLGLGEANVHAWARAQRSLQVFEDAHDDEILNAMRRGALEARPSVGARQPWLAAAAVLVVLAGGLLTLFQTGHVPGFGSRPGGVVARSDVSPPARLYATTKGQIRVFGLPDGSRMTLDTDSLVDAAFTPGRRSLRLERGQAFFEVKHDVQRPFSVQAAGREVVALGTRFEVRLDPRSVRVVLVEGVVQVRTPNPTWAPTVLHAGQQLVDRAGAPPEVSAAHVDEALNWERGFVTFNNDTLTTVAAELNRYSSDRLIVRDPRVAALRITGMFRAGDPVRFGRTLAEIQPVKIVRVGPDQLEIVPAN
jgi:transmembrane sensor